MATTINTNVAAIRTQNVYNRNNTEMNAAMTRVATAQKINSAKDNSSVWAITEKMRERIRANDQANQNIQNDSALLRTAQDGMGNTLSILTTLKERAINAANDSNISSDRSKIVEEVKQLVAQIDDNAAKVKFNGRQLLNGGVEADAITSTAKTNSIVGTSAANAVTATGKYGDKALYGVTGLRVAGNAQISGSTDLVKLLNENGESLFQNGDKITFSWTQDGIEKQKSIAVTNSSTIANLTAASDGLTGAWVDAGSQIASAEDKDGNEVITDTSGVFFSGADNKNISNFSISITNSSGVTREAAQAAFEPTAIQQSYGNLNYGSNEVYNLKSGTAAAAAGLVNLPSDALGDATQFYKFGLDTKDLATSIYKITVDDKTISFTGATTLNGINELFKKEGINVELHYTAAAGDALTYDGKTVTQGTYGSEMAYGSANSSQTATGLNFVVAAGEKINRINLDGSNASGGGFGATNDNTAASSPKITQALKLDESSTAGTYASTASSTLLPQGEALQFFVGGEANFGVNFTIGKATVNNLLGSDIDTFAKKFQTKEGAEAAIGVIDNAINKTLTEQTRLGAMEARLGYTSDNIISMNENLEAGYSAYRDADIAKEMTNYMKYAVLGQASQYMLAQAGQNAYQVLNLLQQ